MKGTVNKIKYRNEGNYYTVALVEADGEEITVVGSFPLLNEGETAEFTGIFTEHPAYGPQFKADGFSKCRPEDKAAILRYLSSGTIRGIGPGIAGKIVEKFGEDALDIIQNEPERLECIRGISLKKAFDISEEYNKQYGVRDIMLMLSGYGISPEKCLSVFRCYGKSSADAVKANPYILCEENIGVDFQTAEEVAADFNIEKSSDLRVGAGIEYIIRKNLINGHTCLPRPKLTEVAARLLQCETEIAEQSIDRLKDCFRLKSRIADGTEYLAIPEYFSAEEHIAAVLSNKNKFISKNAAIEELEIDNIERLSGIAFEELQRKAVRAAFENGVLILTGGPGTGKTTTLNAIIKLFEAKKFSIELAAPTGRAAKRMTELTGREAKTIHRLLEVEWGNDDKHSFQRNEKNPLSCDVLIVDEASMIDVLVFDSLIRALRLSCRLIIVGDSDQLPSIGAGNLLNDLLSSGVFSSVVLKKVFRQASQSMIVSNAHSLIDGGSPDFSDKKSDCFFLKRNDKYEVIETVNELISTRLPKAYGFDRLKDIQVLCPSRITDTGTANLNNVLQNLLNPKTERKSQMAYKGIYFRTGDKVMQIKNNYDLQYKKDNGETGSGVFNGDVGFITEIDRRANMLKVRFDDKTVEYFSEDLGQIELAYAVTVHKSQGSEYDCVILPLCEVPLKLKYRNLLYTAVTRAKKLLILVGDEKIWTEMAKNDKKTLRYTLLKEFIKDNFISNENF